MADDVVTVYQAANYAEAELLRQALEDGDVEAWVDPVPSPLDGLDAMGQGAPVMVRQSDAERARRIIDDYLSETAEGEDDDGGRGGPSGEGGEEA